MNHFECFEQPVRLTLKDKAQSENSIREETQLMATLWFEKNPSVLKLLKGLEKEKVIQPITQSIDAVFVAHLDTIERIDRLAASVESRRNAVFREMDRRRAFALSLRDAIQKAEDANFEIIEPKSNARTPNANGKAA
jgi:hypothetical protein